MDEALELRGPGDLGAVTVLAVQQLGAVAGHARLAQQRHVEAELGHVGRPGAVGQGMVVPAVVVVGRRCTVLGLDDHRLVVVQLDEVDLATHAEAGGLQGDAAAGSLEQLGEGGVVGVGLGRGRGDGGGAALGRGALVLGAAVHRVGGVDEVALDVLEVEQTLAVDQLVAHSYGDEIGRLAGR